MLRSADIRQQFIDYFSKELGHRFVPSSPVVPLADPTLLFTNAGMNQFKPIFLGESKPEFNRAVNSQKCIRVSGKHNDLEEVGRDTYHHTFFEMLGNWSFGDYYKAEAIAWAWKLFTDIWGLDPKRLYATVYKDDDEAYGLWKKISGLPESRVMRFGEKDNFWEMGDTGPCGPCSEIHYYRGNDKVQDPSRVNADNADYIELWNLVFIQYKRDASGNLHPLPMKHVDTGAGFERIVATLNGVNSNYETDVFLPLLEKISAMSGRAYDSGQGGMPHRVIADHIRMLSFAIADGAIPGNEGRSYVLRRILRRAVRYGRELGFKDPFLHDIVPVLGQQMKPIFPELDAQKAHIAKVIMAEEESFIQTLDRGLDIFAGYAAETEKQKAKMIGGEQVFKLYDTFGFPMDLTRLLAEEKGFEIDEKGFDACMAEQKERARAAGKFRHAAKEDLHWTVLRDSDSAAKFVGYEQLECKASVLKFAVSGDETFIVTDRTPFYAESGGQIGDRGSIMLSGGRTLAVEDCQLMAGERVHIVQGSIAAAELAGEAELRVADPLRRSTARNHSATHLLHQALKDVLGGQVKQSGSFVGPDHLRFDFNHSSRISEAELQEIQERVNAKILDALPVRIREMKYDEAIASGAVALFGEKYTDTVRTVRMGEYSFELCGGTHVSVTSDIAFFLIRSESSIASGVRRIEAVTGGGALDVAAAAVADRRDIARKLQCREEEVSEAVVQLQAENGELKRRVQDLEKALLLADLDGIIGAARPMGDGAVKLIARRIDAGSMDQLKALGDRLREKCRETLIVLGMVSHERPQVLVAVTDDLLGSGYHAGKLVGKVGKALGGGGGGRPHMATAGGKKAELLDQVLDDLEKIFAD